ncbi:hypothetical protein L7F22_056928 [Adiantum nelumboides]|nr:hypothetical protein [Adiantum nelumboides]
MFGGPKPYTHPSAYASSTNEEAKRYDYVIVGAGTAGSVLASRLSEDPQKSVLVLEAGKDCTGILETKIPLTFSKLFHGEHDWDYYTTPQPKVDGRSLYWPRGRMIGQCPYSLLLISCVFSLHTNGIEELTPSCSTGGSSSMNAMMYHHGSHSDYDEWAQLGCKGWGYKDLSHYMRKSERFTPNKNRPLIDALHRGDSGNWHTGYSYLTEVGEKGFLGACKDVGIDYNADINTAAGSMGVTRFQTFIDAKGQRSSAATAYLPGKKAVGVELLQKKGSQRYHVAANSEVILCGGAINSPQTLLLSGIGPREELERLGISVVHENNSVGRHLLDHFCTSGILCKAKPQHTLDYLGSDIKAIPSLVRWLLTGSGPLTSNVGEIAAFVRASDWQSKVGKGQLNVEDFSSGGKSADSADIEIIGAPLAYIDHGAGKPPGGESCYSMVPIGLRPQSEGTITLKTDDVFDHPAIDPKYWTVENDVNVLIVGIRICLKLMRSPVLQEYLEPVPANDDPEHFWWPYSSSDPDAITDEQLKAWMTKTAFTLYHPVGTARMSPKADEGVVDLECRVHGIDNLRVIDASVFPAQISGHPTAAVIAIAEKMSDILKSGQAETAQTPSAHL